MTEAAVRAKLAQVVDAEGVRSFARRADLSEANVYQVLKGASIGPKVLKALGIVELPSEYRWAGPSVRAPNGTRAKP